MSITFRNDVTVRIEGVKFANWTDLTITRRIDAVDTVSLSAPFNSSDKTFRDTFKPFSYKPISVAVNDNALFTGVMAGVNPAMSSSDSVVSVRGYASPGVLYECMCPKDNIKTQFKNQTLHDIASALLDPFGIKIEAKTSAGPVFKKIKMDSNETIMTFLMKLAKIRGQIIRNNPRGGLVFDKSPRVGAPVATLREGEQPLISASAEFRTQNYHSELTAIRPIRPRARKKVKYTAKNPLLTDAIRPHVFNVDQAFDGDIRDAANAKLGRMFASMAQYTVTVPTWRDMSGNIWEPGATVNMTAPGVMIYNSTDFILRNVTLNKTATAEMASMTLILGGALTDKPPRRLPWD